MAFNRTERGIFPTKPRAGHGARAMCRSFALIALLSATAAFGFPVTWTLNGVTFADGGAATGSFQFDAGTNAVPNWSVAVSGGDTTTFPAITYSAANSSASFDSQNPTIDGLILSLSDGSRRQIRLPGVSPLTDAGGTVALNVNSGSAAECFNCSPFRLYTAGNLVGTAAPAITGANTVTFPLGASGTFTVTSTGAPIATLSETGTLPPGVTFTDSGDGTAIIAGTPTSSGTFALTITASNGVAPDATQPFTIVISAPVVNTPIPTLGTEGLLAMLTLVAFVGILATRKKAK